MTRNASIRAHLDATVPPIVLTIPQMADLRDAWAVLTFEGTQWMFRSIATGRWLRLPVSDLDGKSQAQVAALVEDALDRLHDLPAIHPAARSANALRLEDKS